MKEKNLYTYFLAVFGVGSLLFSVFSLFFDERAWIIFGSAVLASLISLYPIRLPSHFFYTFDLVAIGFIALTYGWKFAILPAAISLLALNQFNRRHRWFRFVVNLGLYTIVVLVGYLLIHYLQFPADRIWTVLLLYAVFDVVSFVLNRTVQVSVLGLSVITKPDKSEVFHSFVFIIIGSIILYRLLRLSSAIDWIMELILTGLLLYFFAKIANQYFNQLQMHEDSNLSFEQCFNATNQILITVTPDGKVTSINSVAEQLLGYSLNQSTPQTLWSILSDPEESVRLSFQKALSGVPEKVTAALLEASGAARTVQATLVPFTREKKVAGMYLIAPIEPCSTGG